MFGVCWAAGEVKGASENEKQSLVQLKFNTQANEKSLKGASTFNSVRSSRAHCMANPSQPQYPLCLAKVLLRTV